MGKWSPGDRICGHWPCWSVLPCEPWGSWETWRGVSLASHPGLGPVRGLHESCTQLDRVDQGAPCPIQAFLLCLITWLPDGSTSVFSFVVCVLWACLFLIWTFLWASLVSKQIQRLMALHGIQVSGLPNTPSPHSLALPASSTVPSLLPPGKCPVLECLVYQTADSHQVMRPSASPLGPAVLPNTWRCSIHGTSEGLPWQLWAMTRGPRCRGRECRCYSQCLSSSPAPLLTNFCSPIGKTGRVLPLWGLLDRSLSIRSAQLMVSYSLSNY